MKNFIYTSTLLFFSYFIQNHGSFQGYYVEKRQKIYTWVLNSDGVGLRVPTEDIYIFASKQELSYDYSSQEFRNKINFIVCGKLIGSDINAFNTEPYRGQKYTITTQDNKAWKSHSCPSDDHVCSMLFIAPGPSNTCKIEETNDLHW